MKESRKGSSKGMNRVKRLDWAISGRSEGDWRNNGRSEGGRFKVKGIREEIM